MKKGILSLILVILSLSACSKHDGSYYAMHPKALKQALKDCPSRRSASDLSCDDLKTIALRTNQLAYQLRMNQQAFGQKILALQEKQSMYQTKLQDNPNALELKQALRDVTQNIHERLSVVQWLESPRSSI